MFPLETGFFFLFESRVALRRDLYQSALFLVYQPNQKLLSPS